ncbi:MAG: hypothetical protein QW555_00070 [Nitrososphaerota archaeon]
MGGEFWCGRRDLNPGLAGEPAFNVQGPAVILRRLRIYLYNTY